MLFMLTMSGASVGESRDYNSMGQLTTLQGLNGVNLMGTRGAPMRAQAKKAATYSGELRLRMATGSARRIPLSRRKRAS